MPDIRRREFLRSALAGGAALALPRITPMAGLFGGRGRSTLADSHIEIRLDAPIGTIAPEIYGHFTEHLGGVIYDGVWVGEDSKIPNVGGIRKALVDALALIKPSVIRWPGGCFADSYDWRDGVGPRAERPTRTNFWADDPGLQRVSGGPAKYDPNAFGTNEFMRFCRLVGAQPYLAANVRSLDARAFDGWIEYCNAPADATTWSRMRAGAGDREPYGVRYWGVGNEAWGCGGNFTPAEYAEEFRRFTAGGAPAYGVDLRYMASGPSGADREWTTALFAALRERHAVESVWGLSVHHYSSAPDAGADAVAFDERGWYDLLASASYMDTVIDTAWPFCRDRSPAPREAGGGRVGGVARQPADRGSQPLVRVAVDHSRRGGGGAHAQPLQPPRRQGGDGQRRAAGELHPVGVPGARRPVHGDAGIPRVRDVRGASGRAFGGDGGLGAPAHVDAQGRERSGAAGPQRVGIGAERDPHAHRGQHLDDRPAGDGTGDPGRRRGPCDARDDALGGERARREQLREPGRGEAGDGGCPGERVAGGVRISAGVGDSTGDRAALNGAAAGRGSGCRRRPV